MKNLKLATPLCLLMVCGASLRAEDDAAGAIQVPSPPKRRLASLLEHKFQSFLGGAIIFAFLFIIYFLYKSSPERPVVGNRLPCPNLTIFSRKDVETAAQKNGNLAVQILQMLGELFEKQKGENLQGEIVTIVGRSAINRSLAIMCVGGSQEQIAQARLLVTQLQINEDEEIWNFN